MLRISSDGDDRRIFLGLKFSIPGFFWVGKFSKFFGSAAWFNYGFFLVFKSIWRFVVVPAYPGRAGWILRIKYNQTWFLKNLIFRVMPFNAFWIFLSLGNLAWDFLGVNFGPGIFSGFDFFAPIWLSVSLELLQQVERHFAATTNHLVCIGEFVSATEFFGRNKSHKFSLIWFCATCCGGRCGDKTNSVAGMCQRCSQKFSSYTWLPSIQSFSTFRELRLRSGAWSSFLDLSSEWWNLLGVCSIMW